MDGATKLLTYLLLISGVSILIAGVYYHNNNLVSTGRNQTRFSGGYDVSIPGSTMIFFGVAFVAFGLVVIVSELRKRK